VSRAIGLINEYRPGMEFCHRLKDPNSTQWKRIEEAGHHLRDCRKSKFAVAKERFLRSITWGLCEIAMYHRLADYVSDNKTHVMTYEDFVRDEDGGLEGLMAQLYPDRPGGRVEILATRKPSDIVKRSNSQVKKMVAPRAVDAPSARTARSAQVTNAAEVEGWFAEWGGPAPLWRKVQCINQNVAARRQLFAHRHVSRRWHDGLRPH